MRRRQAPLCDLCIHEVTPGFLLGGHICDQIMFWRHISVKLFNIYRYSSLCKPWYFRQKPVILMFQKFKKDFASAIGMGVSSSALKVEEKTPIFYNGAKVVDNNDRGQETFRLYKIPQSDLYEAVLYNAEERTVCLSVFRIEDERKAKEMFR